MGADRDDQLSGGAAKKRGPSDEAAVGDDGERIQVRADVERAAQRLLRAHVQRCSKNLTGSRLERRAVRTDRFGDPEVHHFDPGLGVILTQEQVLGLDVAVDDVHRVRAAEPSTGLADDDRGERRGQRAVACEAAAEIFASQQLHGDEGETSFGEAGVEDGHHVGALDARCGGRLLREA